MYPQLELRGEAEVQTAMAMFSRTGRQAWAWAANRTAEEVLVAQRKRIMANFMVRVPNFTLPPMTLPAAWRATEQRPWVVIALGDQQAVNKSDIGSRRVQILSKFGAAQRKVAKDPVHWPVAIPTPALAPQRAMRIPQKMLPRNLIGVFNQDGAFQGLGRGKRHTQLKVKGRKEKAVVVGTQQVYFQLGRPGTHGWGLYERFGAGAGDIRMLWAFRTSVPIPKLLDFERDAQKIVDARMLPNFNGAMDRMVALGAPK